MLLSFNASKKSKNYSKKFLKTLVFKHDGASIGDTIPCEIDRKLYVNGQEVIVKPDTSHRYISPNASLANNNKRKIKIFPENPKRTRYNDTPDGQIIRRAVAPTNLDIVDNYLTDVEEYPANSTLGDEELFAELDELIKESFDDDFFADLDLLPTEEQTSPEMYPAIGKINCYP